MVHSNCYKIKSGEHCLLLTYPINPNMQDLYFCINRNFVDVTHFSIQYHTFGRSYSVVKIRVPKSKLIVTMYKEQSSEREQEE